MLAGLLADYRSRSHWYYLDRSFEETVARHATKPIADEVGVDALRDRTTRRVSAPWPWLCRRDLPDARIHGHPARVPWRCDPPGGSADERAARPHLRHAVRPRARGSGRTA